MTTVVVLVLCTFTILISRNQATDDHWYGNCKIADGYPLVSFIALGDRVYHDQNSDGIPQRSELIPESGTLNVHSLDGESTVVLQSIAVALIPTAVSDEQPQWIYLEVQSNEFPELRQDGAILTAREADAAGTCHLLGPLSFIWQSPGVELIPGDETELRISLGTAETASPAENQPDTSDAADSIPTLVSTELKSSALVSTSTRGDRDEYAFAPSLRPKMEISFDLDSSQTQTVVFDGFC